MNITTKLLHTASFVLFILGFQSITCAVKPTFGQACQTFNLSQKDQTILAKFMTKPTVENSTNDEFNRIKTLIREIHIKTALSCHQDKTIGLSKEEKEKRVEKLRWSDTCYKLLTNGIAPTEKSKAPNFAEKLKTQPKEAEADIEEDRKSNHEAQQFNRKFFMYNHGSTYIKTGLKFGIPLATLGYLLIKYQTYKKATEALKQEIASYETKIKNSSYPEAKKQEFFKQIKEYEDQQRTALKNIFKPQAFAKAAIWLGVVGCLYGYKLIHEANKEFSEDKNLDAYLLTAVNTDDERGGKPTGPGNLD